MDLLEVLRSHQLLVVLLLLPFLNSASSAVVKWTSYPVFDCKLPAYGVSVTSLNQLHCGRTCSENSTCVSFFYAPGQNLNCQLHDHILESSEGLAVVMETKYYIPYGASVPVVSVSPVPILSTVSASLTPTPSPPAVTLSPPPTSSTLPPPPAASSTATANFSWTCPAGMDIYSYNTVPLADGSNFTFIVMGDVVGAPDAPDACAQQGLHLVRLTTVVKMEMLRHILRDCTGYSELVVVDGSNAQAADFEAEGAWIMSNGEPVPMTSDFWADGYPESPLHSHCLMINPLSDYKFQDLYCTLFLEYICEK